jgi:hypothetical protein
MPRSCAFLIATLLTLSGCDPQIVLVDRESPLPAAAGATASGGTSSGQVTDELPAPAELVWSTDHEAGTIDDWLRGGTFYGGQYEWGDVSLDVAEVAGRNGGLGVALTIDTSFRGEPSQGVRLYRRSEDAPAYYTAWFRLEEAHTVSDWWSISLFHARDETLSLETDVSLWDVRVVDTPAGDLALQFFDHDTLQAVTADARGSVTPGSWFELSVYLDYRPPESTRLAVLLDGVVLFDMKNLHTLLETNVFWAVGNGANGLDPSQSTLHLDDASIRRALASP